jgi:excisionase family DNA binding protein
VEGDDRLLTPNDVAERLNVTVAQVYTLLRGNELPGLKIGRRGVWRIDPGQLSDYVDGLKAEAIRRVESGHGGA